MSRSGARWAVVAAAVVAAVAGALAVLTAAAVPAVVAGAASALVAVLVLVEDPEEQRATPSAPAEVPIAADPRLLPDDDDVDPLQELFESGPPAGGSGLLGPEFVLTTLRGRVAVARRALRPLSVVCFEAYETDDAGRATSPVPVDQVATVLRRTLREADVSGRLDGDAFVCVLEDTGEDGAVWTAERVRRTLVGGGAHRRFRAGVASYPAHGLEPEELESKAQAALVAARDWATDRIEVAGTA